MTKAELQKAYDALKAEHDGFKDKVVRVAGKAAREHELCDVLEQTFNELGIEVPDTTVTVTKTETFTLSGFEAYRSGFMDEGVNDESIRRTVEEYIRWGDWDYEAHTSEVVAVNLVTA